MTLKKENAAPDVVVGAATGQHLCNSEISIPNAAPAGNEKIAVPEAHQGSNSVAQNPDLIESGAAEDIEKNLENPLFCALCPQKWDTTSSVGDYWAT